DLVEVGLGKVSVAIERRTHLLGNGRRAACVAVVSDREVRAVLCERIVTSGRSISGAPEGARECQQGDRYKLRTIHVAHPFRTALSASVSPVSVGSDAPSRLSPSSRPTGRATREARTSNCVGTGWMSKKCPLDIN